MAENVWRSIQAADSRECRYCHAYEHMDFHKQRRRYNSLEQDNYDPSLCLDLHHRKRTLHAIQLQILGSSVTTEAAFRMIHPRISLQGWIFRVYERPI
ncbi:MAG: NapC/NirT family cytochrome c [Candidatus Sedimenticola sp. (ex Thyasira tokunagai)]